MVLNKDNIVKYLMNDNVIQVAQVYSYATPKFWITLKPISVKLSTGKLITVPEGFTTDFSTVPKFLWGIFPPFGDFLLAAIIHDYLYVERPEGITRLEADKEMFYWSNVICDKKLDNKLRYYAARLFGWTYWKRLVRFATEKKPCNGAQ